MYGAFQANDRHEAISRSLHLQMIISMQLCLVFQVDFQVVLGVACVNVLELVGANVGANMIRERSRGKRRLSNCPRRCTAKQLLPLLLL